MQACLAARALRTRAAVCTRHAAHTVPRMAAADVARSHVAASACSASSRRLLSLSHAPRSDAAPSQSFPAASSAAAASTPASAAAASDASSAQSQTKQTKQPKGKKGASAAATPADAAATESAADGAKRESYTEQRHRELKEAGLCDPQTGVFTYPNSFKPTLTLTEFISRYSSLGSGEKSTDTSVCVVGRLSSKRDSSSKLIFYDLIGGHVGAASGAENEVASGEAHAFSMPKIQIMATRAAYTGLADAACSAAAGAAASTPAADASPDTSSSPSSPASPSSTPDASALHSRFQSLHHALKRGDLVWVRGTPAKSKVGELSLIPADMQLLAPCWHEIPNKLTEPNIRYRQRYLDMLVNRPIMSTFLMRSRLLQSLRRFLTGRGFVEVETPILWTSHGGATAKPFRTSSTALGSAHNVPIPLFLRIAPELFLKQLVIGGMERVFEVSKVFRNEGMDQTHNPEFTTVEFYEAWKNYEDNMLLTEELVRTVARDTLGAGNTTISVSNKFTQEPVQIDLGSTKPFARIDVMDGLAAALGEKGPLPDPNAQASLPFYLSACARLGLSVGVPHTLPRVLDKLIGALLETQCIQPTFLVHHPSCMSPLARDHPTRPGLTERFELFINGSEYANAYSELNDPAEQLRRMEAQARAHKAGDEEAQPVDSEFCTALAYGLPPTAGWGLGIDRLVMLLAGHSHIRDVLLFPVMKPQQAHAAEHERADQETKDEEAKQTAR